MRKAFLISLIVFLAVVAGGYCIVWFAQASQIKSGIEQAIARVNEKQKYVTYDAIETSGFPSHIYVSIIKPRFSGRLDPWLKEFIASAHPDQPALAAAVPEWNEDMALNGRAVIGVNALSDKYSLAVQGNWQRTAAIGAQKLSIISDSSGDTVCALHMAHSGLGTLWDFHSLTRDGKDFLRDVRLFDCSGPATVISDASSRQTLISNGPWRFYVSNSPAGGGRQVRLYIKFADVEVTPQGDLLIAMQRSLLPKSQFYPVKYSLLGKQNVEFDVSYTGPDDWKSYGNNPPFTMAVTRCSASNQLYISDATFFLNNGTTGGIRQARLAFKAQENFAAPYDAFLQDMMHGVIGEMYADSAQQIPAVQPWLQKYTPDQMYAIVLPALPNFHSLGQLVQSLDVSYKGAQDFSSGDIALNDLELSASPYGIKGNGSVKRTVGQLFPDGHAVFTCNNCGRLVDDVIAFTARLQTMFRYFQTPEQAAVDKPVDPKLADGIKNFLKALAAPVKDGDPDKDSLTYVIASDPTIGTTVNGRPITEVMSAYQQYVAPLLKASSDAKAADLPAAAAPAR